MKLFPDRNIFVRRQSPIFIGGDGRSGTTLLSVVLDSHHSLAIGPELHFRGPENLGPYILACLDLRDRIESEEEWRQLKKNSDLNAGINFINRCHRFGIDSHVLRKMICSAAAKRKSSLDTFQDRCHLVDELGQYSRRQKRARRWGIKIMRDLKIAHVYASVWPQAQFIHIIRDGRDVAASQMLEHGTWGYGDIEGAAQGWVDVVEKSRKSLQGLTYIEIRYEDLVMNTRDTLAAVLKFLRVPWCDAVMRHAEVNHSLFQHPYDHPSIDTVRMPINPASIGRFRLDLSAGQIDAFHQIAGDYLREFGYC